MARHWIEELKSILPPPASAPECDEGQLRRNQKALRVKFPDDYIEFGRIYGNSAIRCGYDWYVVSPFSPMFLEIAMRHARNQMEYKASQEVEGMPFGIFPELGGILPFATTGGGDWVGWITDGAPNEWTVVDMENYDHGQYELLDMGFAEYFCRVLSRDIVLERHEGGTVWTPQDVRLDSTTPFENYF